MSYSMDLRRRVVDAYESGNGTREELGQLFNLGTATIGRWVRRKIENGTPHPLPRGGGKSRRIGAIGECVLLGILERTPDATLQEIAEKYAWTTHMPMNASVISHSMKRLEITRKKRRFLPTSEKPNGYRNYERIFSKV